jgi:hypothetical protein
LVGVLARAPEGEDQDARHHRERATGGEDHERRSRILGAPRRRDEDRDPEEQKEHHERRHHRRAEPLAGTGPADPGVGPSRGGTGGVEVGEVLRRHE